MKCLIIVYSYHHNNTQKITEVFGKVLDAQVKSPQQTNPEELQGYDLVGFGSGIYGGKAHKATLKLADNLPKLQTKKHSFSQQAVAELLNTWQKHIIFSKKNCNLKAT